MKRFISSKNRRIFYLAWEKTEGFFTTLIIRRYIMTNKKTSLGIVLALLAFGFLLGGCASLGQDIQTTAISANGNKAVMSEGKGSNGNATDYPTEEKLLPLSTLQILKLLDGKSISPQLFLMIEKNLQLYSVPQVPKPFDSKSTASLLKLPIMPPPDYKPVISESDMRRTLEANQRAIAEMERFLKIIEAEQRAFKEALQRTTQNSIAVLDTYLKQHPTNLSK